jgi:hypothetical protein
MGQRNLLVRLGLPSAWSQELALAALGLALGFGLMPMLIFFAGSAALGRYEGASLPRLYGSLYQGLGAASSASWIVVLGPYGLYLLFRALRFCWRSGARAA